MKKISFAFVLLSLNNSALLARGLDLPPRPPGAKSGTEFARSIAGLEPKGREESIVAEVERGNVPSPLRIWIPVDVTDGDHKLTFFAMADYLAVGADDDYFLTPMTPYSAQKIADRLGCTLPTPKMVDAIYAASTARLTPSPIPPSPEMTTVPVFLRHNQTVQAQRKALPPGGLVAGHKKDVVIANKLFVVPGKVAIYGWHRSVGDPIQPLYTGHTAAWVDYSHGVRLVRRDLIVDGRESTVNAVLKDPQLAPLLSREGVMTKTRYEIAEFPAPARRRDP